MTTTTLIIGATGLFGSRVCNLLAQRGTHVLAMTRDPKTAKALTNGNITGVVGDLDDPETLRGPMQQADRVFLVSPMHPDLGRRECDAIKMASECNVDQIVKIMGAVRHEDDQLDLEHKKAVTALENSDLHWTIISPQTVMETNFYSQLEAIRFMGQMFGAAGDGRIGMVSAEDCAEAASIVLSSDPELLDERNLEITGPEALTYTEFATELSMALGIHIAYVDMSEDEFRNLLISFGMPEADLELQALCHFRQMRRGKADLVTNTFEWLTGRRAMTVMEWARKNKNVFMEEAVETAAT